MRSSIIKGGIKSPHTGIDKGRHRHARTRVRFTSNQNINFFMKYRKEGGWPGVPNPLLKPFLCEIVQSLTSQNARRASSDICLITPANSDLERSDSFRWLVPIQYYYTRTSDKPLLVDGVPLQFQRHENRPELVYFDFPTPLLWPSLPFSFSLRFLSPHVTSLFSSPFRPKLPRGSV